MRRELQNHLEQLERCFKLCPSSRAQALERISFISCWCLLAFQLCWAELWSGCMCPQHHGGFLFQPFRVPSIKLLSASHHSQHPEHLAGWLCWDLLRRCTCTSFEYSWRDVGLPQILILSSCWSILSWGLASLPSELHCKRKCDL